MKIALIAPTYLPARRANTVQVMKMAQALTGIGQQVRVYVPGLEQGPVGWQTLAHHYGLQQPFEIEWLPVRDQLRRYDYGLQSVWQARRWGAELIYTRLPQAAALASTFGLPSLLEVHDLPQGSLGPWLLRRYLHGSGARGLVVITAALQQALQSAYAVSFSRPRVAALPQILAPDGVDLARYADLPDPPAARQILGQPRLAADHFVAGYIGHLYPGRGAELILDLAQALPQVSFVLVGGEPADVLRLRQTAQRVGLQNLLLTGFVPNAELPVWQAACDVLLMPYQSSVSASSGGDIGRFLSPMKLFEYLACGRPILSSDLPVLREVLHSGNAVLLPPAEVGAWVTALQALQLDPLRRLALGNQALQDARRYTWEARARQMLEALP